MVIIGASIWTLIRKLRNEKGADRQKLESHIFWGATTTTVLALVNNIIIPLITGTNPYAIYGTYTLIILINNPGVCYFPSQTVQHSVGYCEGAVAYTLSGATLALLFAVVLLAAEQTIFSSTKTSTLQRAFYAGSAVLCRLLIPID